MSSIALIIRMIYTKLQMKYWTKLSILCSSAAEHRSESAYIGLRLPKRPRRPHKHHHHKNHHHSTKSNNQNSELTPVFTAPGMFETTFLQFLNICNDEEDWHYILYEIFDCLCSGIQTLAQLVECFCRNLKGPSSNPRTVTISKDKIYF